MPFDAISALSNPITGRAWGYYDAALLRDRGYGSSDWATATQWAKSGDAVRHGEAPTMVAFTRGNAMPEPGARLYPVFNREQLASYIAPAPIVSAAAPLPLTALIIAHGGIDDWEGDLDTLRRVPGLVRDGLGMTCAEAMQVAIEGGYLMPHAYEIELIDALMREADGHPCRADIETAPAKPAHPSLLTFLVGKGGVRDLDGDLKAMDMHKRRVGLVRRNGGMTPDHAREAATEAHYLPEDSTIRDLYDAMDREARGTKVYPFGAMEQCPF